MLRQYSEDKLPLVGGDLMQWTLVYHDDNARISAIPVSTSEEAIGVVARLMREGRSATAIRHGTGGPEIQALMGAAKGGSPRE
jgi:hypothetical protein